MSLTTPPVLDPTLVAANRAAVYGAVSRWLLHHIRNPAQAIGLVSELLHGGGDDDEAVELWGSLRDATGQLAAAIELLDRTLRIPPPPAPVGPIALPDILSFIAAAQQTQKSAVRVDVGPALEARLPAVSGREDQLEHALLNVVMNALEALHAQATGTVRISAATRDTTVELTIEDDGPGVPPDLRDRLFEPFVTTKVGRPTAGLGLPVARHLLGECGGSVAYMPTAGPGATFVVRLKPW